MGLLASPGWIPLTPASQEHLLHWAWCWDPRLLEAVLQEEEQRGFFWCSFQGALLPPAHPGHVITIRNIRRFNSN